jgi:hypothetical protein
MSILVGILHDSPASEGKKIMYLWLSVLEIRVGLLVSMNKRINRLQSYPSICMQLLVPSSMPRSRA